MTSVSDTLIGGKLIGYSNTFEVRDSCIQSNFVER